MKKVSVLAAAALFAGAAFVSAEGFKLNGYVRAGWSNTIDALDTNEDGDGDTAESSTSTWLAGDYFGGSTRSRLNLSWSNKDESAGAFVRLQYTGAAEEWDLASATPYAYAWVNPFDGKLTVSAGKMKDDWIGSDGYEGFSVLDGKSGFFAAVNPIEGLTLGGGAVVDYLDTYTTQELDEGLTIVTKDHRRASKKVGYIGGKYSTDKFVIDAGFAFAGEFYANANITPVDGLLLAFEYKYDSDDILDDGTYYAVGDEAAEHTFVEQVEYSGIENLLVGVESYQYVNDHSIDWDDSNVTITITPYVRYDFNDIFAASVESTIYLFDYTENPDPFATIVPAIYLKVADGAEASVWGKISTDTDYENHQIGTGVIFHF